MKAVTIFVESSWKITKLSYLICEKDRWSFLLISLQWGTISHPIDCIVFCFHGKLSVELTICIVLAEAGARPDIPLKGDGNKGNSRLLLNPTWCIGFRTESGGPGGGRSQHLLGRPEGGWRQGRVRTRAERGRRGSAGPRQGDADAVAAGRVGRAPRRAAHVGAMHQPHVAQPGLLRRRAGEIGGVFGAGVPATAGTALDPRRHCRPANHQSGFDVHSRCDRVHPQGGCLWLDLVLRAQKP